MTTTTVYETGGLLGKIRALHARPLEAITALVFGAGIIAVCRTAGVPMPLWAEITFGVFLGLAALTYEFAAVKYATRAFFERSMSGMVGWGLVWMAAFIYSANAWLGFASEGQENKTNLQKTAYVVSADLGNTEAELTARNNKLLQQIGMAPTRTAEQAQAAIDNAKANRFWQSTNGCTETKGPQTRQFCDAYASAVADAAGAKSLLVWKAEQEQVAKELKAVREKRANEGVTSSDKRNDLGILVRYTNMGERGAMDLQAVLKVIAISAFLSLTGFLLEKESHHGKPKSPWPMSGMFKRIAGATGRAIYGQRHTHTTSSLNGTVLRRSEVNPNEIIGHRVIAST